MTGADTLASGKGHGDENFPVASLLLKAEHRAPILTFYRFARAADDVADHPTAGPREKLDWLEAKRATLLGSEDTDETALALRETMQERGLDRQHALDLLDAFRRDVTQRRYASWDDLIDYCRVSAMPVGRFVLDVHGEARSTWIPSDALCAALQVINHLQDCGRDYRTLDRVYLPQDMLLAAGARVDDLGADRATPALRRSITTIARRTQALLGEASGFARTVASRRLAIEVAIIHRLAANLAARLCRRDPLSEPVHHRKVEMLGLAAAAALSTVVAR